jgi:hypothetical protein
MIPNVDPTTGISYGVIPPHAVGTPWYESATPFYPSACPECGSWEIAEQEENPSFLFCPDCNSLIPDGDQYGQEPSQFTYDGEGYYLSQTLDDRDIFVTRSRYYTFTEPCSPCAPNAGYLPQATIKGAIQAYCLGHDWFESGQAPYPVFLVETGEEVPAP